MIIMDNHHLPPDPRMIQVVLAKCTGKMIENRPSPIDSLEIASMDDDILMTMVSGEQAS